MAAGSRCIGLRYIWAGPNAYSTLGAWHPFGHLCMQVDQLSNKANFFRGPVGVLFVIH